MAMKMYPTVVSGALVLLVISVGVRSQSGDDGEIDDYDTYDRSTSTYIYTDRPTTRLTDPPKITDLLSRRRQQQAEVFMKIKMHIQQLLGPHWEPDSDFTFTLSPTKPIDDPPPDFPELASQCPPGFQYVNLARSCYKVVYEKHNWASADQRCRDLHPKAHLVAITTKKENIGLKAYLKRDLAKNSHIEVRKLSSWRDRGETLWTSGRRVKGKGCREPFVWKLSINSYLPLSYTHWYPGRPGCFRNKEPCVHLISTDDFLWNDTPCSEKLSPLCEYDLP